MAEGDSFRAVTKRQKMDNSDTLKPIYLTFLSSEKAKLKLELEAALGALRWGYPSITEDSKVCVPTVCALKVETCNARDSVNFTDASITTSPHTFGSNMPAPADTSRVKGAPFGELFGIGYLVLKKYLEEKQIPTDLQHQQALERLLTFLSSSEQDHSALLEPNGTCLSKWSVTLAQHLLSKLALHNTYTISSYSGLKKGCTECLCKANDELVGQVGDTSYGSRHGWHGIADIIMEVPVAVFPDGGCGGDDDEDNDGGDHIGSDDRSDDRSVSSTEVKISDSFFKKDVNQIMVQTIVFSFLQRKQKSTELQNYLIPGIGITKKYLMACFYDTENDILLQSKPIQLFREKSVSTLAVLFLWLTLNYRLFCSGSFPAFKRSNFIAQLGDHLCIYRDEVQKNVHVPHTRQDEVFPWGNDIELHELAKESSLTFIDVRRRTDDCGN